MSRDCYSPIERLSLLTTLAGGATAIAAVLVTKPENVLVSIPTGGEHS